MSHGVVYGLHDPITGELRYIGQTITTVQQRLSVHLSPNSLRRHSYLARWLLGLTKRGMSPTWSVRAEAQDQAELDRLEVEHIARARAEGARLVNISDGGGGRAGYVPSAEEREKIAAAQRGVPRPKHTEEWKARMSTLKAGVNTNTPEHMARLAEMKRGVPRSEETKVKISEAKKGQPSSFQGHEHTEEAKAKISAKRMGQLLKDAHFAYRHDIRTSEILRLLENGSSKVAIAKHFGVSPTFIHRRLDEARRDGVPVPYKKCRALPSMRSAS
jgi:hypothetical protein